MGQPGGQRGGRHVAQSRAVATKGGRGDGSGEHRVRIQTDDVRRELRHGQRAGQTFGFERIDRVRRRVDWLAWIQYAEVFLCTSRAHSDFQPAARAREHICAKVERDREHSVGNDNCSIRL